MDSHLPFGVLHQSNHVSRFGDTPSYLLQISELFRFLAEAELHDILIVGGLVFLFIAVVGDISGTIEPDKFGRLAAGLFGTLLIVTGLLMGVGIVPIQSPTPTATQMTPIATSTPSQSATSTPTPTPPSTPTFQTATGLVVRAGDTSITTEEEVVATIEANQAGLEVTASLLDYRDGSVIDSKDVTLDASGRAKVSFGTRTAGRYVIEVRHRTRGRAQTEPIGVSDA